jgi:cysteine desulfurase/selenocysteine lyase
VNPVTAIGAVARKYGVPYLLDACQSAGQLPLDVQVIDCDMLSGTGRKYLRGPRGTGFLYVRESMIAKLEPPFIDLQAATWTGPRSYELRSDARRFETWEGFIAGRLGLARAVDYALDLGIEAISGRVRSLATRLRAALADVPGLILRDPGPAALSGIVTFTQDGREPAKVVDRLRRHRINVSLSPASHARLDLERRGLAAVVRASLHYFNTEAEIETLRARLASET